MTWFTDELRERASELDHAHGNEWLADTEVLVRQSAFLLDVAPHAPECTAETIDENAELLPCTCWKREMQ